MRPTILFAAIALAATAGVAHADKAKKPHLDPGVWASLVKPGATWTLAGTGPAQAGALGTITVKTYDVRKVGDAEVARLRWAIEDGKSKTDLAEGEGRPTQVAVTKRGVWFLSASDDDKAIAKALKKKPTYADPVVTTKQKDGSFVEVRDGGKSAMVCVGKEPHVRAGCENLGGARPWHGMACEETLCVSPDGIVDLSGGYAPDGYWYVAAGYN